MATLYAVLAALQAQVSAVTQGLLSNSPDTQGLPLTVRVGLFWPSAKTLQDNVRKDNAGSGPSALVTVYDRGLAQDSTRWLPVILSSTVSQPQMRVLPSGPVLEPNGSLTLTFEQPAPTDAVGLVFTSINNIAYPSGFDASEAVVAIAAVGDTANSMAAQAALRLTSHPVISLWLTAVASGNVVTLTSQTDRILPLAVNVGATGTQLREIARRKRHCQIVIWARTPDDRATVADPIEQMIAVAEADFGLTFADGSLGRMLFYGDVEHDEATLSDTLRRDFLVGIDYPITTIDTTYAVLAPIMQYTAF